MRLLAFFSVLVIAFSASATPSEDFKTIQTAVMTSALASDLNRGKPSNEMRETLLAAASPSDQQNIKSMLSRWKKPTGARFEAQLDQLVMYSKKNDEVFRIFPKPNSSGAFYINGREWKLPSDGHVYRSLNRFLRSPNSKSDSQATSSLFKLLQIATSRAIALPDDLATPAEAAAFYYVVNRTQLDGLKGATAHSRLSDNNPSEQLLRSSGGFFSKVYDAATGQPKDIQCTATGAKGRVLVDKEPLEFQTTGDGRVIFRMFDDKRTTFQAKSEITRFFEKEAIELRNALQRFKSKGSGWIAPIARDICSTPDYAQVSKIKTFCQNPQVRAFNKKRLTDDDYKTLAAIIEKSEIVEALSLQQGGPVMVHSNVEFSECQDVDCNTTKAHVAGGQSMSPWIGELEPVPVGLALNHVPRDQRELGYVIDFDCPKDTKCKNLVLKNPERMNAKSLAEAHLVLGAARDYYRNSAHEHRRVALQLAPLHGCCADAACRSSDFGKSLKFVSTDDGTSSGKPTSR